MGWEVKERRGMTYQVVRMALVCVVFAALAFPVGAMHAQDQQAPPAAQVPPANEHDPFFRKPKPQTQAPKVAKANEPVLVPPPTLAERQADFQKNKDLARQRGLPDPDPIGTYLVSELVVTGVFETDSGIGAFVQAIPTKTTFFVGKGTRVYNGDVKAINTGQNFDLGAVVFHQTDKYKIKNKIDTKTIEVVKPVTGPAGAKK